MRYKNIFIACFIACSNMLYAQQNTWILKDSIDHYIQSLEKKTDKPGYAICIIQDGKIVYAYQTGLANLKLKTAITDSTYFNIGSITKEFTAACIYLLEERNLLSLEDSIQTYLPELVNFSSTVKLKHLLSHTSGLHDQIEVLALTNSFTNKKLAQDYVIKSINSFPQLAYKPGTSFAYCNTAYMLLAMVVERISGMSIQNFAKFEIFNPLKMNTASYQLVESKALKDHSTSYYYNKQTKKYSHTPNTNNALGATGVHCTLGDFYKWDQNFYHNQLGNQSDSLIIKMTTPFYLINGQSVYYGGGTFIRDYKGNKSFDHSGGWNNFLVQYRQFPELKTSIIVACNNIYDSPFKICDELSNLLIENKLPKVPYHAYSINGSIAKNEFCGRYISDNNRERIIQLEHDTLKILTLHNTFSSGNLLSYLAENSNQEYLVFTDKNIDTVYFHLDSMHHIDYFNWSGGDYFKFNHPYYKLNHSIENGSKIWEGTYRSDFLKYKVSIKFNEKTKQYIFKPNLFMKFPLRELSNEVYNLIDEKIYLRFSLDHQMTLGHDWIQNISFTKIK